MCFINMYKYYVLVKNFFYKRWDVQILLEGNEQLWVGFNSDILICAFKAHSGCQVDNRLKGAGSLMDPHEEAVDWSRADLA